MSAVIYNLISAHRDTDFLITGMSRFWAERYFAFLRTCSFVLLVSSLNIVFSSALSRRNYRRCMAFSCFLLCLIMLHNFHARFQFEYNYYGEAAAFESALPGETVAFHYPHGWQTFLVKK